MSHCYQDLIDTIGVNLAERLSIDLAGNCYYFGSTIDRAPEHFLDVVRSIGLDATKLLIHQYPNPRFEVPAIGRRRARDRMIRRLSLNYSSNELAVKFGMTRRRINHILRPTPEA